MAAVAEVGFVCGNTGKLLFGSTSGIIVSGSSSLSSLFPSLETYNNFHRYFYQIWINFYWPISFSSFGPPNFNESIYLSTHWASFSPLFCFFSRPRYETCPPLWVLGFWPGASFALE